MSRRLGSALLLLAAAFLLLQGAAQAAVGSFASAALSRRLHGKVTVTVRVLPFWRLASGRFDRLTVQGTSLTYGRVHLAQVSAVWQEGQVDLPLLLGNGGRVIEAFRHVGDLEVNLRLTPQDLFALLPQRGPVRFTAVRLKGPWVYLGGVFAAYGVRLPFTLKGAVFADARGDALVYRVVGLGSSALRLRSSVRLEVADLRTLGLYPFVRYRQVRAVRGTLWVRLTGGGAPGP